MQLRQKCQIYSRIVGWLTPVHRWNPAKEAEFYDRKTFIINEHKDGEMQYQGVDSQSAREKSIDL